MHCIHRIRIKTKSGHVRFTDCRKCLPCRLTKQYDWADRLRWEIERAGHDKSFFLTLTFDREHLPWSDPIPAGKLSEAQDKLLARLLAKMPRTEKERDRQESLIKELRGANPAKPTVRRKILQDWKKRCRMRLGFQPRILSVMEYGTARGRPHAHAVVIGITQDQANEMLDAWPFSQNIKEAEPVQSAKIGGYISKDIVKGTASKDAYIASGREAPFMLWPVRPCLAAGQEEEIYGLLSRLREICTDYDFEHRIQLQHVGRTFVVRRDGKAVRSVRYGKTAYTKALARIDRNEAVQELVAEEANRQAEFRVTHVDPTHPHFLQAHGDYHDEKQAKAERKAERAKLTHARILERKRRRGSAVLPR